MNPNADHRANLMRTIPRAFTLVEVLIVVVLLGIMAAIVTPQFSNATNQTKQTAFVRSLTTYASSAQYFMHRTGQPIGDTSSGVLPTNGFEDYIDRHMWIKPTPIGGVWDTEDNLIGVHFDGTGDTRDATYMAEVDLIMDDGDLTTGSFRQTAADRFYYLLSNP